MKIYDIDIQRFKAMGHDKGLIELRIDAQVQAQPQRDEGASSSRVQMSVDNARALLLLLKKQLADLDKTKARSQR